MDGRPQPPADDLIRRFMRLQPTLECIVVHPLNIMCFSTPVVHFNWSASLQPDCDLSAKLRHSACVQERLAKTRIPPHALMEFSGVSWRGFM